MFTSLDSRFDCFLYAPVFERDGLPVSVLSVLTRQNLDPWDETARLASMPRNQAIDCVAATIWRSNSAVSQTAASELALRLVEFLPTTASADPLPHDAEDPNSLWLILGIFLFMMALSAGTGPRSENNLPHQTRASAAGQPAQSPSGKMVLMQPRE